LISWSLVILTGATRNLFRGCPNAIFRQYKQQRPTRGLYDTITFYHPSFGYVRLVDKQFFPKTLGGQTYTPARFEIEESQQSGTPVIDATVKLGRLSSDIKALMKQWKGRPG
jgi:hypothetical protein